MIQHVWTIPCRLSLTDRQSNNISLIEVLEELSLPPQPAGPGETPGMVPAFFEVVTLWGRGTEDLPVRGAGRFSLVSPQGETLLEQEYEIDLTNHQRTRAIGKLLGFPAVAPGRYHFGIACRTSTDAPWTEVARVPLWVHAVGQESEGTDGPRPRSS